MFINIFLSSNGFGDYNSPWAPYQGKYDTSGYPSSDFGVTVFTNSAAESGNYSFSCLGKCTSIIAIGAVAIDALHYDSASNRTNTTIVVSKGASECHLKLQGTGMSNMKLLRPNYTSDANVFTNDFTKALKAFSGMRFMDTQATNNSTISGWTDRPMPSDFSYAAKGISYEDAIKLGAITAKDVYLHIPHMADDDFIARFATLAKKLVPTSMKCYVEYSNEIWNGIFTQADYNINKAIEESKTDTSLQITKTIVNRYYQGWCRTAKMAVKISKALDYPNDSRFRPVLATQLGNTSVGKTGLEYINRVYGAPSKFIFGLAGAPYFGNIDTFMDRDDIKLDEFFTKYAITFSHNGNKETLQGDNFLLDRANGAIDYCADHFALAKTWNVVPMSYEGGLDMGQFDASVDVKTKAQDDPRMGDVHKAYYTKWFAQNGGQFFHYKLDCNYSKWGYWGLTDNITETDTPKMKAAADVSAALSATTITPTPPTPANKFRLSGVTYNDKNKDGKREGSEAVPNIKVNLIDDKGVVRSTISDKYGFFLFNNVIGGNYQIVYNKPIPITVNKDMSIDLNN